MADARHDGVRMARLSLGIAGVGLALLGLVIGVVGGAMGQGRGGTFASTAASVCAVAGLACIITSFVIGLLRPTKPRPPVDPTDVDRYQR